MFLVFSDKAAEKDAPPPPLPADVVLCRCEDLYRQQCSLEQSQPQNETLTPEEDGHPYEAGCMDLYPNCAPYLHVIQGKVPLSHSVHNRDNNSTYLVRA